MKGLVARLASRFEKLVWDGQDAVRPAFSLRILRLVRIVIVLVRDLAVGQITLRAMGLVYTTLLSIVPMLALSFSVLKAFGVYHQIQPMLVGVLAPLGEKGEEVARRIVQFIENMNVGVLGVLGVGLLVYTAISLMQKIEEALNHIWHIPRPRRFGERFSRYLVALMVGPILVFSAMGITATVLNIESVRGLLAIDVLGDSAAAASQVTPYLLVITAFTFLYMFVPNTKVRFVPALVGGIAGGIAWQTAGWAFANFVASSSQYAAIYSGLAILALFMIWLYVSWLTVLFGASVAFYLQHPEYLVAKGGEPRLSNRMRERLALSVMCLIVSRFLDGEPMPTLVEFARMLMVPTHSLLVVLNALEGRGLLALSGDDPPAYLLARDPSLIAVSQVLDTVRAAGEEGFLSPEGLPAPAAVDALLDKMQRAVQSSVGQITLRELAMRDRESI